MRLRTIEFGPVLNASGARNFDGRGYPIHRLFQPFGLDWSGSTFVAKTTTCDPRPGNMSLRKDGVTPRELVPRCIVARHVRSIVLNAVGLSGPGAKALFLKPWWREWPAPFFISYMSVEQPLKTQGQQLQEFIGYARYYLPKFRSPVGLEINVSCPNVGLRSLNEALTGMVDQLSLCEWLGDHVPVMLKFSVMTPAPLIAEIAMDHEIVDAVHVSNTIPWGQCSEWIDWPHLFGSDQSPLAHLGGGGLSGAPLLPVVVGHIARLRAAGMAKPIVAGGGVLSERDADCLLAAGANAISLGSIAILRPWRVRRVIRHIHRRFARLAEASGPGARCRRDTA